MINQVSLSTRREGTTTTLGWVLLLSIKLVWSVSRALTCQKISWCCVLGVCTLLRLIAPLGRTLSNNNFTKKCSSSVCPPTATHHHHPAKERVWLCGCWLPPSLLSPHTVVACWAPHTTNKHLHSHHHHKRCFLTDQTHTQFSIKTEGARSC